jgi:hypothetical protein
MLRLVRLPLRLLALTAFATLAQAEGNDPGSLLIFPEYDARPGALTFLTVTNTNADPVDGSVRVHFTYVNSETCLKTEARETLTPRDTVTLLSHNQAPHHSRGFCFAYADDMTTASPTDFDFLIGSAIILDGTTGSEYSINALIYEGQTGHGNPTNVDGDSARDLDGLEYGMAPDKIAIPRFFGQTYGAQGSGLPHAELVFVGMSGTQYHTTVNILVFNDNEEVFSAEVNFNCWARLPLIDISALFSNDFILNNTNHDSGEIFGWSAFEAGWLEIDGTTATTPKQPIINDPAFLATLIEVGRLSSAALPFTIGEQSNGSLLPHFIYGG